MPRRLLDASVTAVMIAVAVVVCVVFVVSTQSRATRQTHVAPSSSPPRDHAPTLAELADGGARAEHAPRSRWPSAADYGAIVSARVVIHDSLRQSDWRSKSFGALLGIKALMTIHPMASGRCAWLVNRTYDELRDFENAYAGENWAPMVTVVRHDPPVTICRAPARAHATERLTS